MTDQDADRQTSNQSEPAGEYQEIEHTADLALRVHGEDLVALFVHAAHGMFHLLRCRPAERPAEPMEQEIELDAPDIETLLVDWLDELLYLSQRTGLCFDTLHIHSLDKGRLKATVHASGSQTPQQDIKAVTFSNLRIIRQKDGAYETTITFDV